MVERVKDLQLPIEETIEGNDVQSEVLSQIFRKLGRNSSFEILTPLINEWLVDEKQRGVLSGSTLEGLEAAIQNSDVISAINLVAETLPDGKVHGSMNHTISDLWRSVSAGLKEEGKRKIEKGMKATTLTIGSEAHRIAESLLVEDDFWNVLSDKYDLVTDYNNNVIAFIEKRKTDAITETQMDFFQDENIIYENSDTRIRLIPKAISLEIPIPGPEETENYNPTLWALRTIKKNLNFIYQNNSGILPERPHDIAEMMKNEKLRPSLVTLMEISQFIFGSENGLSQVKWEKDTGFLGTSEVDKFKTLDILILQRMVLERFSGFSIVGQNEVILTELPEGNIVVSYSQPDSEETSNKTLKSQDVKLGKIDLLSISFESEKKFEDVINLKLSKPLPEGGDGKLLALCDYQQVLLRIVGETGGKPNFEKLEQGNIHLVSELIRFMSLTLNSHIYGSDLSVPWTSDDVNIYKQALYSRLGTGEFGKNPSLSLDDAIKLIGKDFKKDGRNLEVLVKGLYDIYGERVIEDVVFKVGDLKFLVGDAGWHKIFLSGNLPQEKDRVQVTGYLYKIAAQLYKVHQDTTRKIGIDRSDKIKQLKFPKKTPVDILKVTSFIKKHKLHNRVTGNILYQTPNREIPCEVKLTKKELNTDGKKALRLVEPEKNEKKLWETKYLRVLRKFVQPRLDEIEVVTKETKKMPEALDGVCIQNEAGTFLCVDNLLNILDEENGDERKLEITRSAMLDSLTRVIWIKNIKKDCPPIRISVNHKGRYTIEGFKEFGLVKGSLLSSLDNEYADEDPWELTKYFDDLIFNKLGIDFGPSPWESTNSIVRSNWEENYREQILMPDGSLKDPVPGKPIICDWDPMTNKWRINPRLLEMAAESGNDKYGTITLYKLVKNKVTHEVQLPCPGPIHANLDKESPAATWYPDDGRIWCFGECQTSFDITEALGTKREWGEVQARAEVHEIADFRQMSEERKTLIISAFSLTETFKEADGTGDRYLEARGLDPSEVGPHGFVPEWFMKSLWDLTKEPVFQTLLEHSPGMTLDQIPDAITEHGLISSAGRIAGEMNRVTTALRILPNNIGDKIMRLLPLSTIHSFKEAGVINYKAHLSGLAFPLYWPDVKISGPESFLKSNADVRGIELNGKKLFTGPGHWKIRSERKEGPNEDGVLRTPAGLWVRDPGEFLSHVENTKTVFLWEGILNALSYERMAKIDGDLRFVGTNLVNTGVGHRASLALLRQIGIKADKNPPQNCLGYGIEGIVLCLDFDSTGAAVYEKRKDELLQLFEGIEVAPIHDFLPQEFRRLLLPFDSKLYGNKKDPGVHFKKKYDMNDVIRKHKDGWVLENEITPELEEYTAYAREKYAYKSTQ